MIHAAKFEGRGAFCARKAAFFLFAALAGGALTARAQQNFEIQVYESETVAPGRTMVELHSNYAIDGQKTVEDGVLPDQHAWHETIEITHGFTDWFETGFYIFSSIQPDDGLHWAGDHIRPRVRVPPDWNWPLGVSLSTEIGYQPARFTPDTWTWEIRPIIDKRWGPLYIAFNPALERAFQGPDASKGFAFAPNVKISYDVIKEISVGVEYYGDLGEIGYFDKLSNQQQAIYPAIDLNFSDDWEVNFGVGFGLTQATDNLVVKLILGHRF